MTLPVSLRSQVSCCQLLVILDLLYCRVNIDLVGEASINTYVDRVRAALGALPQELRFVMQHRSKPVVFESIPEATEFLKNPSFDFDSPAESFIYEITYSDGYEFDRPVGSLNDLRKLHHDMDRLAQHVSALTKK